jgi:Putative lumazine-binding
MKSVLKITAFALLVAFKGFAQSEDNAIKLTLNNYLEGVTQGDTSKLNKAFHATAVLKTFNTTTGKIQDFPVKTFIAKTPAGGVQANPKIISYSYAGISAAATVELAFEDFKYIDQLSLLKINEVWKIVARVYSRVDLGTETKGSVAASSSTSSKSVAKPAPKKPSTANIKPKKDDGW